MTLALADLQVPAGSEEMLAVPAVADYARLLRQGQEAAADWRFALAGMPAPEWRALARSEVLAAAARMTEDMDSEPAPPLPAGPLLVTGHQPDLYHPGVWVKNFIVDLAARRLECPALNVVVDSDLPGAAGVAIPRRVDGRWTMGRAQVPGLRTDLPWEAQPPLDDAAWRAFVAGVESALDGGTPAAETFRRFRAEVLGAASMRHAASLADSLARARRLWEGEGSALSYREIAVSAICGTRAFMVFAAAVLERLEAFWEAYNASLHAYRKRRGIRTAAHPMPDLRRRDRLWETPFWYLHPDGERRGLFAEGGSGRWKLMSRDDTFLELDGSPATWAERLHAAFCARGSHAGTPGLRPRALTLTLFLRLAVADLFIHGVGGAHYDVVTDEVARAFFGVVPPGYAAASATVAPELGVAPAPRGALVERVLQARRRRRDLVWNPQRYVDGAAAPEAAVKDELIRAAGGRPADRALAQEIHRVNAALAARLGGRMAALEPEIARAREDLASHEAATYRGYPYFLFEPGRIRRLVPGVPGE